MVDNDKLWLRDALADNRLCTNVSSAKYTVVY